MHPGDYFSGWFDSKISLKTQKQSTQNHLRWNGNKPFGSQVIMLDRCERYARIQLLPLPLSLSLLSQGILLPYITACVAVPPFGAVCLSSQFSKPQIHIHWVHEFIGLPAKLD